MSTRRRPLFPTVSKFLLGTAMLLGVATAGRAATETFTLSFPGPGAYQTTNWSTTFAVTKFDPSLGVLQSIDFQLTGRVQGTVKFENLDAGAATITTDLQAIETLKRPGGSSLVISQPVAENITSVTAYDGTTDYAGTSGRTFNPSPATDGESSTGDTNASDLSLFTGPRGAPGTISLPLTAQGISSGSGAGNLATIFQTLAGADAVVTYNYTPAPEPGTCALVLGGLGALVGVQRFRRRK